MPRELPRLDPARCEASGRCVDVCPEACLEEGPWLPRPLDCTSCSACVLICPTGALKLEVWLTAE